MAEAASEPLDGFGPAIRTFWVTGIELQVFRRWSSRNDIDPQKAPELRVSISGKAISDQDDVCVIGTTRRTTEFNLNIISDAWAKENWELQKASDVDLFVDTPEHRIKKLTYESLDQSPPTAILFTLERDRELGIEEGWHLECMIPQAVLEQLEADITARKIDTVTVGIHWTCGLVFDQHAPLAFPTSWGLFKTSEHGFPEPLRGHIESLGWKLTRTEEVDNQKIVPMIESPDEPQSATDQQQLDAVKILMFSAISNLTKVISVGFIAVFVLVLLTRFFRG